MPGETHCPVCGRQAGPPGTRDSCAECGWALNTPLWPGPVTADMRRDFDKRLRVARTTQAERDEKALEAALVDVVAAVRPDREAAVIEIGPDRIDVATAYLDAMGSPRVRDGSTADWRSVLPKLPGGERERHAQLADGVAGLDDEEVARLVRDGMQPVRGDWPLVVCRPAGWRVLEAAAKAVARAARPPARLMRVAGLGDVPVRSLLADVAARAPLRRPYYLLTVTVDARTGEVRPRPKQVFAVGATPGTVSNPLYLRRIPGDVADTTLAIFAGNGVTDLSVTTPLALHQVPFRPEHGREPKFRAVLGGPGRVQITEPSGGKDLHPDAWKQVYRRIPSRVTTTLSPVDLVCAIDLSGTVEAVLRRKGLVRDLVQLLDVEYPSERYLRVAIVTCTDHVFGRGRGKEDLPVTSASELGAATDALAWLDAAEGVNPKDFLCAPVEDLLAESLELLKDSRGRGRGPRLVTLAGRPPHPFPQRADGTMACPLEFDWRQIVAGLAAKGASHAVVVDDLPRVRTPARADWDRLGPAGQYALPTATAREVAEDLGLLAAPDQRIPLPLSVG